MSFCSGFQKQASISSELKHMWNGTVHDKSKEPAPVKKTLLFGGILGGLLGANAGLFSGMTKGRGIGDLPKGVLIGAPVGAALLSGLHKY